MNIWSNAVITNKGLALQAKLVEGNTLEITKAVVGTGFVAPALLIKQTGVTGPKQTLAIQPVSYPETGKCAMTVYLTNDGVTSGYTAKQIGIYANDPDEGEILYFIAESTDEGTGTVIPSASEMPGYSGEWTFYFQYGQADGVQVEVDPTGVVCQSVFDEAMEEINEALQECKDEAGAGAVYCTCSTVTGTAAKVATVVRGNFKLETGVAVDVKFTNANSAGSPTLNVNGAGAKAIKMYSTTSPNAYMWSSGAVVHFVYDGQYWLMENGTLATTTYYGVTRLNSSVSSTSISSAATPSAVKQAYDLAKAAIPKTQIGAANGVAGLDPNGKVPIEQIPDDAILAKVSDIVDAANTINFNNFSMRAPMEKMFPEKLSVARHGLSGATVGGWYALFAGGSNVPTSLSDAVSTVDCYDYYLIHSIAPELAAARWRPAATTVGQYTLFAGGCGYPQFSSIVDAYASDLSKITTQNLSIAREELAAATVLSCAFFAGGREKSGGTVAKVDHYNGSLTHEVVKELETARCYLAAAAVGNYVLFAGGVGNSSNDLDTVDAYDFSLNKTMPLNLSVARYNLAAAAIGDYALFAGGNTISGGESDTVDAYNPSLTRTSAAALSKAKAHMVVATTGGYALFAGGNNQYEGNVIIVDAYDASLTRVTVTELNLSSIYSAAATVGDYALFVGGSGIDDNGNDVCLDHAEAYEALAAKITIPAFSRYQFNDVTEGEQMTLTEKTLKSSIPLTGYIKKITQLSGTMTIN